MDSIMQSYQAGDIETALSALRNYVKNHPDDHNKRLLLVQFLCINNELEKADKQLDIILSVDPQTMVEVTNWRQLIRAAKCREEFYFKGRAPELAGQQAPLLEYHLKALLAEREDDFDSMQQQLQQAEDRRQPCPVTINGKNYGDIRDLDDLLGGFFEFLATSGKYYWLPTSAIMELSFEAPKQPIDLLWRRAKIHLIDGTEGEVFFPTTYIGSESNNQRLARETDWVEQCPGVVRGLGQKTFLIDEETISIMEVESMVLVQNQQN